MSRSLSRPIVVLTVSALAGLGALAVCLAAWFVAWPDDWRSLELYLVFLGHFGEAYAAAFVMVGAPAYFLIRRLPAVKPWEWSGAAALVFAEIGALFYLLDTSNWFWPELGFFAGLAAVPGATSFWVMARCVRS